MALPREMPLPQKGNVVHYVPETPGITAGMMYCLIGIVGDARGEEIDFLPMLQVDEPTKDVPHDEIWRESQGRRKHRRGTWHWPEQVNDGFKMEITKVPEENDGSTVTWAG